MVDGCAFVERGETLKNIRSQSFGGHEADGDRVGEEDVFWYDRRAVERPSQIGKSSIPWLGNSSAEWSGKSSAYCGLVEINFYGLEHSSEYFSFDHSAKGDRGRETALNDVGQLRVDFDVLKLGLITFPIRTQRPPKPLLSELRAGRHDLDVGIRTRNQSEEQNSLATKWRSLTNPLKVILRLPSGSWIWYSIWKVSC
jgi:hypothetical protein